MKMRSLIVVAGALLGALQAQAQGVPCASDEKPEERHSANLMVILFQPAVADNTMFRIYDEHGAFVRDEPILERAAGKPSTFRDLDSFYPEKRYLATPDSTHCVQGAAKRKLDRAQCEAWFQMKRSQSSPVNPVDIVIEAPDQLQVGVTLKMKTLAGGWCTRTYSAKEIPNVFQSEAVSVAVRDKRDQRMPLAGCTADVAGRDAKGRIRVSDKPDIGQAGYAPSANGALIAQCKQVIVRVRE
jgi:hypothetical protein